MAAFMKVAVGPMADEDLAAVISYLRSQDGVKRIVPRDDPTILGDALIAFGVFAPAHKDIPPHAPADDEPSIARGRYLAEGPANCVGCHTNADPMQDMKYVNEPFSGGGPHHVDVGIFVPPNLTPDVDTGVIASWSEEQFVARFRSGATPFAGTIMPWNNYAQMTDADLRSLYRFLRSLPGVRNDPGPVFQPQ
jgi:mono/diheme cytochrome c family protein